MVEFYLLAFPRFPLRKKEHKSCFGKDRTHDFHTSRCAGYLLDHSGDMLLVNVLLSSCSDIMDRARRKRKSEGLRKDGSDKTPAQVIFSVFRVYPPGFCKRVCGVGFRFCFLFQGVLL